MRGDVFEGRGAHGRQAERDALVRGGGRAGVFPFGLHHTGEAGGRQADRHADLRAEDLGGEVGVGDVSENSGVELEVPVGHAGAVEGDLVLCGTVDIVEGCLRGATLGDLAEFPDRGGLGESPAGDVEGRLLELHQFLEVFDRWEPALECGRGGA